MRRLPSITILRDEANGKYSLPSDKGKLRAMFPFALIFDDHTGQAAVDMSNISDAVLALSDKRPLRRADLAEVARRWPGYRFNYRRGVLVK